jgi:glyoxylase-like metal-dependent hydrolase (beta-lactamase superfamily II)
MHITSLTPDLGYLRIGFVNVYFFGRPDAADRGWVLIDAGILGAAGLIQRAAAARFGADARPAAIILTHGHFDHRGALRTLAERWDATIYAHERELPFLTGQQPYPAPNPAVGGGAMAAMSPLFPREPIDLRGRIRPLPSDGSLPGMPGWQWIPTPGHTTGHVSLFRPEDRTLIAGDAFVTTKQESLLSALTYRPELHGPPAYFTPDWTDAWSSVDRLANLEPELIATGHGPPLKGEAMRRDLHDLADRFPDRGMPEHGRIADRRAPLESWPNVLIGTGAAIVAGLLIRRLARR